MRARRPFAFAALLTIAAAGLFAAERPERETSAPSPPFDAPAQVTTGGPIFASDPVRLRLADLPTGNPDAGRSKPRSHAQGGGAGSHGPGIASSSPPETDEGVAFGPGPGDDALAAPSAVGAVRRNFEGEDYSSWIPPDPVIAVGPKYVVEVVNSGFTVFSKDGDLERSYTYLESFFSPLYPYLPVAWSGNAFVFDPRVIYSPEHDRFVIFALGRDDNNDRSYQFLAISGSDSPLGDWDLRFYYDQFDLDAWIDYSGLSADEFGLYFTGNAYYFGDGFKHAILLSIRPTIFTGGSGAGWIYTGLTWNDVGNPLARTLQPAVPKSTPLDDETFFVNTFITSGDTASIWELTGDRGNSPTVVRHTADVSAYADPGLAAQPAGADDLEMFNAGTLTAAYACRKVYFSLNDAGTGQSAFYVGKLDVDTYDQDRNVTYYTGGYYYFYPAVGLYGASCTDPLVGVAMSYSSDAIEPSGAVKVFSDFVNGTSGPFPFAGNGVASYHNYDDNGRNRWGDYSGVARDWSCNTLWTVTEYAESATQWTTRIAELEGDTVLPEVCRLIFDDGFERGSSANWS